MKKRRAKRITFDNIPLSEVPAGSEGNCKKVDICAGEMKALPASVQKFVEASLAINTRKAYLSDIRHFRAWGGRLPATPEKIAQYLAEHANTHANSTLQRRLVALSIAHHACNMPDPVKSYLVRSTLRGIRRGRRRQTRQAHPLLKYEVERFANQETSSLRDLRNRALLLVGFAGALRRSELVAIDVEHLEFLRVGIRLTIPRSKTDPYGVGRVIFISRDKTAGCPVGALEYWLFKSKISHGAVFRLVNSRYVREARLSPEFVSVLVKKAACYLGKDPSKYSAHSLRAGYVTSAALQGESVWQIQTQTGHSSIEMVSRYVRLQPCERV